MRFFRNRRRMLRRRMRSLTEDRVPMMYRYDDECCSPECVKRHENHVAGLSTNGTFKTKDIEDVLRAVNRNHFTFNNGMKLHSPYFDTDHEPSVENDFHVCFAPIREVDVITNYAYILNAIELTRGDSFLHLGSGTGYLNTLAGLIIGATGINHGMELHDDMLAYAEERQDAFKDHCPQLQNFEYCEPVFFQGDCLKLSLESKFYDRIYCSGILPDGYDFFLRIYLKPGGVLVYPKDTKTLVKIWLGPFNRYVTETEPNLSSREFRVYRFTTEKSGNLAQLPEKSFPLLQELCRANIRTRLRANLQIQQQNAEQQAGEQGAGVGPENHVEEQMQEESDSSSDNEIIHIHDGVIHMHELPYQGDIQLLAPDYAHYDAPEEDAPEEQGDRNLAARYHIRDLQQALRRRGIADMMGPPPRVVQAQVDAQHGGANVQLDEDEGEVDLQMLNDAMQLARDQPPGVGPPGGEIQQLFMGRPVAQALPDLRMLEARAMMRRRMVHGFRPTAGRLIVGFGPHGEPLEESSEEENLMMTIARRVCRKCQMIKVDNKPRQPSPLKPDLPDVPNTLNFTINQLPLPRPILMYLKYKQPPHPV